MSSNFKLQISNFLLELFFPSFCLGCQKEGFLLCQDCKSTMEISEYNYCLCNKNPFRIPPENKNGQPFNIHKGKCSRCSDKKLSGLYFTLPYKEKFLTKKIIHQFKYQPYIKNLAKNLADLLIEHFVLAKNNTEEIWVNSILIPVPLEKKKLKSRGYNQAEELAKKLSEILKIPLISNNLIKIKRTQPQIKLSSKEREENLKNAFLVEKAAEIKNKKIFLVDDVYTTGSTMEECSKVLKDAGVRQVWGIAIARDG